MTAPRQAQLPLLISISEGLSRGTDEMLRVSPQWDAIHSPSCGLAIREAVEEIEWLRAENKRLLEEVERIDDLFLNREKDLFIQRREIERLRAGGGDMTRHRPAPLPIRLYLRAGGFQGITLPWGRAYYWPWPPNPGLVAHEQVHLDQLARLGPWRFTTRYLWLLMRHGYEQHPMEIEAREISGFR